MNWLFLRCSILIGKSARLNVKNDAVFFQIDFVPAGMCNASMNDGSVSCAVPSRTLSVAKRGSSDRRIKIM
jgi:hypothetical protein